MNVFISGAKIKLLCLLLALFSIASMTDASASTYTADCVVDKAVLTPRIDPDTGIITHHWVLKCSGGCAGAADCKSRSGTDAAGEFSYCGCGSGKKYWPGKCCSLVLRPNLEGGPKVPTTWGECTGCTNPLGNCSVVVHPLEPNTKVGACTF